MYSDGNYAQITIHYTNGETELFKVYGPVTYDPAIEEDAAVEGSEKDQGSEKDILEHLQQTLPQLLEKRWLFLQLAEETICINTHRINRIEIKPLLAVLPPEAILGNGERVTALTRNR
jgi:hypothetical protein